MTDSDQAYCPVCLRLPGFCLCDDEEPELTTDEVLNRSFEQMVLFEKRLDAQEELIANLMLALSQMSAGLEALITEVMAPRSEEEKLEFKAEMKKRHMDLLKAIQEVNNGVERRDTDDESPVANLVREHISSPTEPQ